MRTVGRRPRNIAPRNRLTVSVVGPAVAASTPAARRVVTQLRRRCPVVAHRLRSGTRPACTIVLRGGSGRDRVRAARALAAALARPLWRVDGYIGETEKRVVRLFDQAATQRAVLFFDEADALFGKRSVVKDSHDRYANQQVSYLLARAATHGVIVVLATTPTADPVAAIARRAVFADLS